MNSLKVLPGAGLSVWIVDTDIDEDNPVHPVFLPLSDHVPDHGWRWATIALKDGELHISPGEIFGIVPRLQDIHRSTSPTTYLAAVRLRAGQREICPDPSRKDIVDMRSLNRAEPSRD